MKYLELSISTVPLESIIFMSDEERDGKKGTLLKLKEGNEIFIMDMERSKVLSRIKRSDDVGSVGFAKLIAKRMKS